MAEANALVVFHSRSGITRRIAQAVAESLQADIEEIVDLKKRTGLFGFLGAGRDAMRRACSPIGEPVNDPADYDIVIVGSPVWVGRMSSPVRSYLSRHRGRFRGIAFFCTCGGKNNDVALFAEMAEVADCTPRAVMMVTDAEEAKGTEWDKVRAFLESLAGPMGANRDVRRSA